MKPASKPPNIWALASVTYGAVILVTVLSVVAYFYIAPKRASQSSDSDRTVVVGSVWIPIYPGSVIANTSSVKVDDTTESTLTFDTRDPADKVLLFYQAALKKGIFRFETVQKNADGGGTVRSVVHQGKTTVAVTVGVAGEGSRGKVQTVDKDPHP